MVFKDFQLRQFNPAQILVMGFGFVILVGTILLSMPFASADSHSVGILNALFTSTSAVCVTGLVVVDTGTHWTMFGKAVILTLIQIGGLGFMTTATLGALIIGRKITLKNRIIMQEALNHFNISGVVRLTKYIILLTFSVEALGAVALSTVFIPMHGLAKGIFYSVFHSVSAFCNAGFDVVGGGRSLTPFVTNPTVNFTVMTLIIVGGIGFTVILDLLKVRRFKKLSLHSKFVLTMTAILLVSGFFIFLFLEYDNPATLGELSFGGKLMAAAFQSVTPRTAGFNTIDLASMEQSSKFMTNLFMFIGGSPGSTAGGIKTTTIGLVFLIIYSVIRGKTDVEIFRRRVNKDALNRAITVFGVGITIVIMVTALLTITEVDKDFMDIFFEAVSAFGTVGLSLGITSSLTSLGKLVIIGAMFAGRVGPLTIIIALASRQKYKALLRYPEDKISIG